MPIPNKIGYTHGSTGTEPAVPLDYENGDPLDSENLDFYLNATLTKINALIDALEAIDSNDDAQVDSADHAADADTLNGNSPSQIQSHSHGALTNVLSDQHHARYTDSEARTAVDGANVSIAGDANTVDGYEGDELLHSGGRINLPSVDINAGNFTPLMRYPGLPADTTLHVERAVICNGSFGTPAGLSLIVYDATNDTILKSYNGYNDVSEDISVGGIDVVIAADNGHYGSGTGSNQGNVTAELASTLR